MQTRLKRDLVTSHLTDLSIVVGCLWVRCPSTVQSAVARMGRVDGICRFVVQPRADRYSAKAVGKTVSLRRAD